MREFGFELRLCAHLERTSPGIVARQVGASVGPGRRIVDTLLVEPGPEFGARAALTDETLPATVLDADVGVGTWTPVTDAFDCRPERARELTERAATLGVFERERRGGRDVVRWAARYPDWVGRLVGVENKPDLDRPGDLHTQLRKDVSLGVLDAVVLATETYVTRAHLNRIPEAVGVWRVDFDRDDPIEVVRDPAPLDVEGPGLQVVERHPGRTDVVPVSAGEKARERRRVAERAYGKGWRVPFPACERVERATQSGTTTLPHCAWKGRLVDPGAECGPACPGHVAADPPVPEVELTTERERRTGWRSDPDGVAREQAGLDRFE